MAGAPEISKNLQHYVKEVFIVVLGLGFVLFVEKGSFASNLFDKGIVDLLALTYFVALYFSLTYDWIAYCSLTEKFPYLVTRQTRSLSRFYVDIIALLVKTLLIYLSTREVTIDHVISTAALFAIWHASILAWYFFAHREGYDLEWLWLSHVGMVLLYVVLAILIFLFSKWFPDVVNERGIIVWSYVLCGIIFLHALWRTPYLFRRVQGG